MYDNVIISIKGRQVNENGPDEIELVTEGCMLRSMAGDFFLTYQETELTGLEGTTTTLRSDGPRITLIREGTVNSQMVFEEGKRHLSMYETPYGALSVGINTRRVRNTIGEGGGDLEIDYAIEIDNLLAGRNFFSMNVRKDTAVRN